jgi:hypothetical protein
MPAAAPVPQAPAASTPISPASDPAANPYGSFVNAAEPGYPQAAPSHLDGAGYRNGYAAGQQAVAAGDWYSNLAPDTGHPANGYLPAPAAGTNGGGNGSSANGTGTNGSRGRHGYPPIDYSNLTYSDSVYPDLPPALQQQALAGYGQAGPHEQRGYPADGAYGQDGFQGYPGYGNGR